MSNKGRFKNLALNVIVGYFSQIGILILSFVSRRIFVKYLSADYLGINGLYSNILSVLALAELGLGNVTQFFLYKPVVENDKTAIASLFRTFKKLYFYIAITVLSVGILLIPVLKHIVNGNLAEKELIIYYIIFLLNSVITYFSAPHIALLAANQDNRLHKFLTFATTFIMQFMHIAVLLLWHNYTVYLFTTLLCTLFNVVSINIICKKRYAYLKLKNPVPIDKTNIIKKVKSTFLYKIGAVVINNTDNILISVLVSTAAVGLYSNYYMVVNAVQGFIAIITTSLISGIGNLSAEGNKKKMHEVFDVMLYFYHIVSAFGSISFYLLFNNLITFWLGEQYVLNNSVVFAIVLNFYITNAISPIWMYREANGLFEKVRYLMLVVAFANITLSVVFGYYFGIFGVLIATSVARLITQVWYEPRILFANVFDSNAKDYWKRQGKYFLLTIVSFVICYFINGFMGTSFIWLFIKAMVFLIITLLCFWLVNRNNQETKYIINVVKSIVLKMRNGGISDVQK